MVTSTMAMIPSLRKVYGVGFSSAVVAAAANLGPIIPPSGAMIVYAFMAGPSVSVGGMFMAGVIPGLILGAAATDIHVHDTQFVVGHFHYVIFGTVVFAKVLTTDEAANTIKTWIGWVLIIAVIVIMMTLPGRAFFYGGLVRSKNALNTMMMSFISLGFVGVLWAVVGYSLSFSAGNKIGRAHV